MGVIVFDKVDLDHPFQLGRRGVDAKPPSGLSPAERRNWRRLFEDGRRCRTILTGKGTQ